MASTFAIVTYGCASNKADSLFMETLLYKDGWTRTNEENADIVIVNSCTVKGPTESKITEFVKKLAKTKQKYRIIISGCLPSDKSFISKYAEYSLINPYNIQDICKVANQIMKNKKSVHLLTHTKYDKTKLYYKTKGIAIVQPLIGCLGECTFCKTKHAKPVFFSYPLNNIISRIEFYISQGVKEIWISSEDNGAYGKDIGLSYIDLLYEIEKRFAGKAVFRFGMINPEHIKSRLTEIINFFKTTKAFFKFLHIPIQSASDSVLKKMNRPYSVRESEKIFSCLQESFKPNKLTLATDVILGFPSESEEDFEKTVAFLKRYPMLIVNISQFWQRPFTKAFNMKQIDTYIKKQRSKKTTFIVKQNITKMLSKYVGKTIYVYCNGYDSNNNTLAKTNNYVSVVVKNKKLPLFVWHKLKVKKVENNHLII